MLVCLKKFSHIKLKRVYRRYTSKMIFNLPMNKISSALNSAERKYPSQIGFLYATIGSLDIPLSKKLPDISLQSKSSISSEYKSSHIITSHYPTKNPPCIQNNPKLPKCSYSEVLWVSLVDALFFPVWHSCLYQRLLSSR